MWTRLGIRCCHWDHPLRRSTLSEDQLDKWDNRVEAEDSIVPWQCELSVSSGDEIGLGWGQNQAGTCVPVVDAAQALTTT